MNESLSLHVSPVIERLPVLSARISFTDSTILGISCLFLSMHVYVTSLTQMSLDHFELLAFQSKTFGQLLCSDKVSNNVGWDC